jgi:hypothetical protein
VVLPAWLAVTPQLPAVTNVSVLLFTLHTTGVVEVIVTGKPDVALALKAVGTAPKVWLPGDVKLMVWLVSAVTGVLVRPCIM